MPRGYRSPIGTRRLTQNGYIEVQTERGQVKEHTLVMETKLGRPLEPNEWVRHKNGIKTDSDPDNLYIEIVERKPPKPKKVPPTFEQRLDRLEKVVERVLAHLAIDESESERFLDSNTV